MDLEGCVTLEVMEIMSRRSLQGAAELDLLLDSTVSKGRQNGSSEEREVFTEPKLVIFLYNFIERLRVVS